MDSTFTLFGLETLSPYVFFLAPLVVFGVWRGVHRGAVTKTWEGKARPAFLTRARTLIPKTLLVLGMLAMVLALADITRKYVVTKDVLAVNRLIITLDNSSSMYNFTSGGPIHCTDRDVKSEYPRIANACRAMEQLIASTEAYAKKKEEHRQDKIAILRFGLNSFVEVHPSSDYARLRTVMEKLNWRDPRTGIYTEIHLALRDMYEIALQRNFRGDKNNTALTDSDKLALYRALRPEDFTVPFFPPRSIDEKLIALRKDLRDTAFIIISDAQSGQFEARLNKDPVSFIKMMQLAKYLELPVHVISIMNDHEFVRKLAEDTGYGPPKGPNRGAFHLLHSEKDYAHMDEIVDEILKSRFRVDSTETDVWRESFAPRLALFGFIFLALGMVLSSSRFGRVLTQQHGGKQ